MTSCTPSVFHVSDFPYFVMFISLVISCKLELLDKLQQRSDFMATTSNVYFVSCVVLKITAKKHLGSRWKALRSTILRRLLTGSPRYIRAEIMLMKLPRWSANMVGREHCDITSKSCVHRILFLFHAHLVNNASVTSWSQFAKLGTAWLHCLHVI